MKHWNSNIKVNVNSSQIKKDILTYEQVWDLNIHCCKECGKDFGADDFLTYEGKVNNKSFYSHIFTKKAHPELRNNPYNFWLLCQSCHSTYEFGKVDEMNIYEETEERKILLRSGVLNSEISSLLYFYKETVYKAYTVRRVDKLLKQLKALLPDDEFKEISTINFMCVIDKYINYYKTLNVW